MSPGRTAQENTKHEKASPDAKFGNNKAGMRTIAPEPREEKHSAEDSPCMPSRLAKQRRRPTFPSTPFHAIRRRALAYRC